MRPMTFLGPGAFPRTNLCKLRQPKVVENDGLEIMAVARYFL